MKLLRNIRFPQKSLFGFRILSSFESSLSVFFLLVLSTLINPFFGNDKVELIAGLLFNLINSLSILILIFNLVNKRNELSRKFFYLINFPIIIFCPYSFYLFFRYVKIFFLENNSKFIAT